MAAKIVPLDKEKHKGKRIRKSSTYAHAAHQQMIPLVVHEIPSAAIEFPLLFVKDGQTGEFRVVALCGISPNENLYASATGWDGIYVPSILRNYPLSLAATGEKREQLLVCVDEQSSLLNDEEGELLFDENGNQTDFLKASSEALVKFSDNAQVTSAFLKLMVEKELLMPKSVQIDLDGEKGINLGGFYVIDENKFNALDDDAFLDMRKRGFLPAIYSQLGSLNQIYRLSQKKNGQYQFGLIGT